MNKQQNKQTDKQIHTQTHVFIYIYALNTVQDSRVLSRLIVANGLRRVVDEFSLICVLGDSSIN